MPGQVEQIYEVNNELSVCLWDISTPRSESSRRLTLRRVGRGDGRWSSASCPAPTTLRPRSLTVNSCLQPGQVHSQVGEGDSLRLGEGMETGQHFTCSHVFVASSTKGVKIATFSWDQTFSYNLPLISRPFGAQFNKNEHLTQADRHTGTAQRCG